MRLRRHERGYITSDGHWLIEHDFLETDCECPPHLCHHDAGVKLEWFWFVFDATKDGDRLQGTPDAIEQFPTLAQAKRFVGVGTNR